MRQYSGKNTYRVPSFFVGTSSEEDMVGCLKFLRVGKSSLM